MYLHHLHVNFDTVIIVSKFFSDLVLSSSKLHFLVLLNLLYSVPGMTSWQLQLQQLLLLELALFCKDNCRSSVMEKQFPVKSNT